MERPAHPSPGAINAQQTEISFLPLALLTLKQKTRVVKPFGSITLAFLLGLVQQPLFVLYGRKEQKENPRVY